MKTGKEIIEELARKKEEARRAALEKKKRDELAKQDDKGESKAIEKLVEEAKQRDWVFMYPGSAVVAESMRGKQARFLANRETGEPIPISEMKEVRTKFNIDFRRDLSFVEMTEILDGHLPKRF